MKIIQIYDDKFMCFDKETSVFGSKSFTSYSEAEEALKEREKSYNYYSVRSYRVRQIVLSVNSVFLVLMFILLSSDLLNFYLIKEVSAYLQFGVRIAYFMFGIILSIRLIIVTLCSRYKKSFRLDNNEETLNLENFFRFRKLCTDLEYYSYPEMLYLFRRYDYILILLMIVIFIWSGRLYELLIKFY